MGSSFISYQLVVYYKIWKLRCAELHGTSHVEIENSKKERILQEIRHIQLTNKEILDEKSTWIHKDIIELEKLDSLALEAWVYGAKIIAKINQKKIRIKKEIDQEKGIFIQISCNKRDKAELDPGEKEIDQ